MERDYSYSSQVNRRLSAARFLIEAYSNHQAISSIASERQAYIDSILLQLYFACVSYCNELLFHHQRPALEDRGLNLADVFDGQKQNFMNMSEFNELQNLYSQKSSGLFELCRLFESLSSIGSKQEQEENRVRRDQLSYSSTSDVTKSIAATKINLFDMDQVKVDLADIKMIKNLLQELQDLIDRQREYLLEY